MSWATPNANGSPITGYTLTSNPAGGTATAAPGDTSAIVTGLANGTAYTINVVATNAVGDSAPGVSNSITTYDVPSAPTSLVATMSFGYAMLTWNDPTSNGGQGITGYAFSWTDGTTTWSSTAYTDTFGNPAHKAVLEGLQDGVSFTFSVHAINPVGDGVDATVVAATPCGGVSLSGWPILDKSDLSTTGYISVFARDLNGDGNADILALASNGNNRATFYGNGDGTFDRAQLVSGVGGGLAVTGDFNGDGVPDYVADVNLGGTLGNLEFFAGYVDGGFGPGVAVGTLTSRAVAAAVGYIDGDNHLDVVFSPGNTYSVFLGQGDGTFPVRGDTVLSGSQGVRGLALGDLDGDTHPDLVIAMNGVTSSLSGSAIFVQRGNGDGTFQPGTEFDTLGYFSDNTPRAGKPVVITDFNQDNKLDVLTAGDAAGISLLLGLGDGGLAAPQNFATTCWHDALLVADVNHDGLPDLIAAGNGNCSPVSGNATYSPGFLDVALGTGTSTLGALRTYAVPAIGGIAAADFDHDGNLDLALAPESDIAGIIPVHGLGDGGFELPAQYTSTARLTDMLVTHLGTSAPLAVISLEWDVNNSFTMQVVSRQVNADGTLQAPVRTTLATNQQAGWPFFTAADLNGDGNTDLVISEGILAGNTSAFDVYTGDGAGHFTSASRTSFSSSSSPQLAAVDVNHDTKVDVVVNTGSQISIYPGNGNGTFGLSHAVLVNQVNTNKLAVADLNHDGNPDLFVPPLVALGNGDFTFQTAVSVAGVEGNAGWPLVADFNNDGNPDLLAVGTPIEVGLSDGDGGFSTVRDTLVDYDAMLAPNRALAVADMDGDGNLDLVAAGDFGSVAILYGAGDGTFTNQVKYPAGAGVSGVATADLNGDGRPDVAAIVYDNYVAQYLDVLLNQASACY